MSGVGVGKIARFPHGLKIDCFRDIPRPIEIPSIRPEMGVVDKAAAGAFEEDIIDRVEAHQRRE